MSVEEFSYATFIPVSDVLALEADKRNMTELEEQLCDAWRGGYQSSSMLPALKELGALRAPLPTLPVARGKNGHLFGKHYARLRYSVDRARRIAPKKTSLTQELSYYPRYK